MAPGSSPPSFTTIATLSFSCMRMRRGSVMASPGSVGSDLADFDHFFPAGEFDRLELRELFGRVAHDVEAQLQQLGPDGRVVEGSDDRIAQLLLRVGRDALRRGEGLPGGDDHALD